MKTKSKRAPEAKNDLHQEIHGLGVLMEGMDDKIDLVAEQYGDVRKSLEEHTQTLAAQTEMIGKIAVDTVIIKEDLEFIKNGLKKKIDVDEFAALERRVALLERRR